MEGANDDNVQGKLQKLFDDAIKPLYNGCIKYSILNVVVKLFNLKAKHGWSDRNKAESSSAPRRSERARKERNLDLDFIDSQAIIFLVEGDNENNVVNKIPVLLNVEDTPKIYK
nr:retrovirus-related Pol polyprotein from transposon TNT 1-94 [Tanacetum cinerariifolium]